eukprot:NODE_67_length_25542_cov_1.476831.p18 type:complete len:164 gc:universal NODE_67_length_25542_cov_1.476831:13594-13103(-)
MHKIKKLNETELKHKIKPNASWHHDYSSNWIFVGNVKSDISNADLLILFSQYGEPVHLERNENNSFAFLKYQNFNSTVLAIDNFNGSEYKGCILHIDHAKERKSDGNPLFELHPFDVEIVDKFLSIVKEYGGNCSPELYTYKEYVLGNIDKNPLRKKKKIKEK